MSGANLKRKLDDLQHQLSHLIQTVQQDQTSDEQANSELEMLSTLQGAQTLAAQYKSAFQALTFARDRQTEAAQSGYGTLSGRFAEAERKLTLCEAELQGVRSKLKAAQAETRKLLASKRWQAGELVSRAVRRPGLRTLALPVRLIQLVMRRG